MKKIVVLGAGFGGLACALGLAKKYKKDSSVSITLVDRHEYHLFTPNLFEVATAEEEFTSVEQLTKSIVFPISELIKHTNIKFIRGEVRRVNRLEKKIQLDHRVLDYDYAVLALGSTSDYHNIPGAEQFSMPLKQLSDALRIRNKLEFLFESQQLALSKQPLRIVIAGGGYTAVEFAGELHNLVNILCWKYGYPPEKVEVVMVEAAPELMAGLDARMSSDALVRLKELGIRVQLSSLITNVSDHFVEFLSGEKMHYDALVWAAGIKNILPSFDVPVEVNKRGAAVTNEFLQSVTDPYIFVVGDQCCAVDASGKPSPPTAQDAKHEGKYVAYALPLIIQNKKPQSYKHLNHGFIVNAGGKWALLKDGPLYGAGLFPYAADRYAHFRYYRGLVGWWKALKHVYFESEVYSRND